jgi:hypothetical protein
VPLYAMRDRQRQQDSRAQALSRYNRRMAAWGALCTQLAAAQLLGLFKRLHCQAHAASLMVHDSPTG